MVLIISYLINPDRNRNYVKQNNLHSTLWKVQGGLNILGEMILAPVKLAKNAENKFSSLNYTLFLRFSWNRDVKRVYLFTISYE